MAQQYESYTKVKELGAGTFGKAFLVQCQSDNSYAVIKQIDINSIKSARERDQMEKEGKILESLNHVNIIGFREVYKTKRGKIWIVMDYADGGDLSDKIKKMKENFENFSEDKILSYFTQIWLAIKHIHDRKIIHRDLKAQNIFLQKNEVIKLGDFGIAKVLEQTVAQAKTQVGTPYYISPEIIKGKAYSLETDIWSLGIILYELWALDVPIKARNLHELYMKISNCKSIPRIPSRYSKDLQDLIDEILVTNPAKRPNINQILKRSLLKTRAKQFLDDEEYKQEFSHTILHNQYLFEQRKNRAKPVAQAAKAPTPKYQQAKLPKKISNDSPFVINSIAPESKHPQWKKQSPRATPVPGGGGFVGHKPLSNRKVESSQNKYRPASAKWGNQNQQKKAYQRPASGLKNFMIKGEDKPIIHKNDDWRRIKELLNGVRNDKNKESDQKWKQEDIINDSKIDSEDKIDRKVKNIYSIESKEQQEKVKNDKSKPLNKPLNRYKKEDENSEVSKESSQNDEVKAKLKLNKYRKSLIKFLDSESDEENKIQDDGLETNRELSDQEDRDDDNILNQTSKSSKSAHSKRNNEEEKDLNLDSDDEIVEIIDPPVPILGQQYFEVVEPIDISPSEVMKDIMRDTYGVEYTQKGIDWIKEHKNLYDLENRHELIQQFKTCCFNDTNESITNFIAMASSFMSLWK